MTKHLKKTPMRVKKFLRALARGATVSLASEEAGVATSTVYKWRKNDADLRSEWDQSVDAGTDRLEDEAYRRAIEGIEKPVFYQGKAVAYVRDYSDSLLVLMLKARRPEKFKDSAKDKDAGKVDIHGARDTLISKLVQATDG